MTKADFIEMCSQRWDNIQNLNKSKDLYEYEKTFVTIWDDLGKDVLESNLGAIPSNYRKKKLLKPPVGK